MRVSHLALLATLGILPTVATAQSAPPTADPAGGSAAPVAEPAESDEDIVVTGQRPPGSVPGDIQPERTLSPADIRSYGVGSVSELLAELTPQTTSGRGGQPVVLLNGRRISSFAEIRDVPTEAILRVDILPEEVALKFGYRADQKVVNFVLRPRFRAKTVELTDRAATAGGRNAPQVELDLLNIRRDKRFNLHTEYQSSSALTEDERDIPPVVNPSLDGTDQRPFRTLLPQSQSFSANAVYARNLFGNVAATLNGRVEVTDSWGRFGLSGVTLNVPAASPFVTGGAATSVTRTLGDPDFAPLSQHNSALNTHLGSTLNGDVGTWRWSLTGNYDRSESKTFTETGLDTSAFQARLDALDPLADPRGLLRAGDLGVLPANRGYSTSNNANLDALFSGTLLSLPAGPIATSIRVGATTSDFNSRSERAGLTQPGHVSRDIVNGQLNVDLPITSRTRDVLKPIGNLSANFNIAADNLSDFGTLTTIGYGLNWSPVAALRVLGSVTDQDQAPSAQQLGNPVIATPNVRVFDYRNGVTTTVTQITGGNPALIANNRHVQSLGVTLTPWSKKDLTFTANYVKTKVDNPIAGFPSATAAIEMAFPRRFTRDLTGRLTQIDARPINFASSERSQLRWGINFSKPIKSKIQKELEAFRAGTGPNPFQGLQPPGGRRPGGEGAGQNGGEGRAPGEDARPRGGEDGQARGGNGGQEGGGRRFGGDGGGGGGGGGRGFGGRGGGGQGGGRLNFALYHTWHFTDRVTVANSGPVLDLLNGDTVGQGGGQSRHELEGQAGYNNNGLGLRLSANWQSGTAVNGGTATAPETLNFGSLTTLNLRLFADPGQRLDLLKKHPWLRGVRVSLSVDNLTNAHQRVTDGTGITPVSYAPDYLDPLGRTVRLSIRKLFF